MPALFWEVIGDVLNFLAGVSGLYLLCFWPISSKNDHSENPQDYFKRTLSYIAMAVLSLRGMVWLVHRYFYR